MQPANLIMIKSVNSGSGLKKTLFLALNKMKKRQDNNIATIQVRKEQWVYYFSPFYRLFHNFIYLIVKSEVQPRSHGLIRFKDGGRLESGVDPGNEVVRNSARKARRSTLNVL